MTDSVSILGTVYKIRKATSKTDQLLESYDGYCDFYAKLIVIDAAEDGEIHDHKAYQRKTARHEITHAFFYESGLCNNAHSSDGGFATDEELIDWIAIQGQKLHKAWEEAECLD